ALKKQLSFLDKEGIEVRIEVGRFDSAELQDTSTPDTRIQLFLSDVGEAVAKGKDKKKELQWHEKNVSELIQDLVEIEAKPEYKDTNPFEDRTIDQNRALLYPDLDYLRQND